MASLAIFAFGMEFFVTLELTRAEQPAFYLIAKDSDERIAIEVAGSINGYAVVKSLLFWRLF
jgi:hypothetical protein